MTAGTVREEAARWFALMHNGTASPDTAAWHAWMDASPDHAREYTAFEALWRDFDTTSGTQALADAAQRLHGGKHRSTVRRKLLGLAGLGLAGLLGRNSWDAWQDSATYAQSCASGIGERIAMRLPDGSRLTLGPASSAALRYSRRQRAVVLGGGEALFDVARDTDRPFVINAGDARITVLGTRFAVSLLPGLVRVSVQHGTVELAAHGGQGSLRLQAGEVGEIARTTTTLPQRVQRDAQDAFAAMEQGLIVFDRANLGEIAATLSRWRRQPVHAETSAQEGPRITAAVQAGDVEGFIQSLPHIAAVRVRERDGTTWLARH